MGAPKKRALTLTTTIVLSLSLFLLSFIFTIVKSAHKAALDSQKNIKLELFFKEDFTQENESSWIAEIQNKPEILKTQIISKEQAQIDFKNLMKNEWGSLVEEASLTGKLPASFVIEFQQDTSALTRQKIAQEIVESAAQFTTFDGSVFQKDWAQWFADYSTLAQRIAMGFSAIIFVMLYFIISNLIRSQVTYKAEEIEILSFLGSTKWQVQKPFVIQAIGIGFFSAAVALGLLYYLVHFAKENFLARAQLFSLDLILTPSFPEALGFILLVSVLCGWAARACVQERLHS